MKIQYSLSTLLSLILPSISFFLLLIFLGTNIEFTVFTAFTIFVFVPTGSIALAITTAIRKKNNLTKAEIMLLRLGILIAAAAIISFVWFQYL